MSFCAVVVDVAPDAVAIASRLADRPGLAFLHAADRVRNPGPSYIGCDPVESSSLMLPPLASSENMRPADTRGRVPRWIGVIPYEHARVLERPSWTRHPDERSPPHVARPAWHRYPAVVEVDEGLGVVRVVGDDESRVLALARDVSRGAPREATARPAWLRQLPDDDPPAAHLQRIRRAQELIRAGDLYQVNLARRQRFETSPVALDLYLAMARTSPTPFGACIDLGGTAVCACSPELFLSLDARGQIRTAPIKGSRPRGHDAADDLLLVRELAESRKEQAELTMILDVERNDLGRVAVPGSVRLVTDPAVSSHRTIHHRSAVVGALLRPDRTPLDLMASMFPSGSVTGAPKVRAMEVIAELEPVRRGLYTGAFGSVGFDGTLVLAMAIRLLTVREGEGHYFAGGGIVADSDPEAELRETGWKGAQLEALVAGRAI